MSNGWASIRVHTSTGSYNDIGRLRRMIMHRLSMVSDRIFIDKDICDIVTNFCWCDDVVKVMTFKDSALGVGFKAWLDDEIGNDITDWFRSIADDYYATK